MAFYCLSRPMKYTSLVAYSIAWDYKLFILYFEPDFSDRTVTVVDLILQMYINGRHIDSLIQDSEKRNIHEFGGPPCNVNPCMNGGVCVPRLDNADCRCPKKYMGNRCERCKYARQLSLMISFQMGSFITYMDEKSIYYYATSFIRISSLYFIDYDIINSSIHYDIYLLFNIP